MTDRPSCEDALASVLASTRALAAPFAAERFLHRIVDVACVLLGAKVAAFWHCVDNNDLELLLPVVPSPARLMAGNGLAGHCAQSGRLLHVTDVSQAGDSDDLKLLESGPESGVGSVLCLPVLAHDDCVLGVLQLLHARSDGFDAQAVLLAQVLAAQAAVALQHTQLAASTRKTSELHSEVEVAREIQRATLPEVMPDIPGYDLHGHFQPATYAGGDLFDVVRLEHGVFLLLGDATGHGFGPALSAIQMQGMLRVAFRMGADLDSAYLHVNNQLAEDLPADRFITAFMGFLDSDAHSVRYHAAGQGPILHFHAAEVRCEWHKPSTFPVGVLDLEQVMQATTLQLAPGDILGLISDGLYERTNADDTEFGAERVGAIVQSGHALPMAELCQQLLAAAETFADGCTQDDDVTMVLVRRTA